MVFGGIKIWKAFIITTIGITSNGPASRVWVNLGLIASFISAFYLATAIAGLGRHPVVGYDASVHCTGREFTRVQLNGLIVLRTRFTPIREVYHFHSIIFNKH